MIDFLISEGFVCQGNPSDRVTMWKAPHLAEHGLTVTAVVGTYRPRIDVHQGEMFILELSKPKDAPLEMFTNSGGHLALAMLPAMIAAYTYAQGLASRLEAYFAAQEEKTPC
jgi:hypothetical protein